MPDPSTVKTDLDMTNYAIAADKVIVDCEAKRSALAQIIQDNASKSAQ